MSSTAHKRKERDVLVMSNPIPGPRPAKLVKPSEPRLGSKPSGPESALNDQLLLAGYLAHEFVTKGTLFGQPWDSAGAEAVPVSARPKSINSQNAKAEPTMYKAEPHLQMEKYKMYLEVADLLKTNGAHIPGIVNPTQLDEFLQLR